MADVCFLGSMKLVGNSLASYSLSHVRYNEVPAWLPLEPAAFLSVLFNSATCIPLVPLVLAVAISVRS